MLNIDLHGNGATLATKANKKGVMMEEGEARKGRASRNDGTNQLFIFPKGKTCSNEKDKDRTDSAPPMFNAGYHPPLHHCSDENKRNCQQGILGRRKESSDWFEKILLMKLSQKYNYLSVAL